MDNMGGLQKLYYIDADDFISLTPDGNNLNTLVLKSGSTIDEIEFTQETGKISESKDISDNGSIYNFEVSCSIPKCGPNNSDLMGDIRQKKIMILGIDDNENIWLTGAPGSYFNVTTISNTGTAAADLNSLQLKISASLMQRSVFITSPF